MATFTFTKKHDCKQNQCVKRVQATPSQCNIKKEQCIHIRNTANQLLVETLYLLIKCDHVTKNCQNVIKKRDAVTFCHCEISEKLSHRSAVYVEMKLIVPLNSNIKFRYARWLSAHVGSKTF